MPSENVPEAARWLDKAARIEDVITGAYWPPGAARRVPIAAFSPTRVFDVFDLATCALLSVSGTASALAPAALDWIGDRFLAQDRLPPAFHPVIMEGDPDWAALERYQLHGFRNRPHEYHNGGIWMIWLGWLAVALALSGRERQLAQLVRTVAAALAANAQYGFEEYFHGVTGVAMGTTHMAYSATGVVFLDLARTPGRLALFHP